MYAALVLPDSISLKYGEDNRFAFEFYRRLKNGVPGSFLGSYYFVNGPTQYAEQYRYHVSVTPTFGGVQVVDMGNAPNMLRLRGEFHVFFKARPPAADGPGSDSLIDQAKSMAQNAFEDFKADAFPLPGINVRSGRMEYSDFIGLLYGLRREDSRYTSEDTQGAEITAAFADAKFDYSKFALIYRDFARARAVEVIPAEDGVSIERSTADTNTYQFQASFVVVDDRSPAVRQMESVLDQVLAINPFYSLSRSVSFLKTVLRMPLKLSGALAKIAQFTAQFADTGNRVIEAWDGMTDQFDRDGKLARKNFEAATDNISRTGRTNAEDEKRDELERFLAKLPGTPPPSDSGRNAEFRNALRDFSRATDSAMAAATTAILAPPESAADYSQNPTSDFTPLIASDIYEPLMLAQQTIIDIQADLQRAESDSSWTVFVPAPRQTFEQIAEQTLGDITLAGPLATYNGMSVSETPNAMPLRIPNNSRSLIISRAPVEPELRDLERSLLGSDIGLTGDRDLSVSSSGDLAAVHGEAALQNNVLDAIDAAAGSLPIHTWWGNPVPQGEVLSSYERRDAINRLLESIRADPRVAAANLTGVNQIDNQIRFTIRIRSTFGLASWFVRL